MDFLETDFHKKRNPKRNIQFRNNSNLLVGLSLSKYSTFNSLIWKLISHAFKASTPSNIRKGVYRTTIPTNLLDLVKLQVGKVTPNQIKQSVEAMSEEIKNYAFLHKDEYDLAQSNSIDAASVIIRKNLVLPFIGNIEKPVENLKLGDENNLFLMEEELTSVLTNSIENKISELLKQLMANEKVQIVKELLSVFEHDVVKRDIATFFENYEIGDLFSEVYELDRNKAILDKQEFYLYFCDISFNGAKYPIFYIPINIERHTDTLHLEFDSQVYINRKALEYISQEYNSERKKHGSLKEVSERILYLAQFENDFLDKLQSVIHEITNFFDLDKSIILSDFSTQHSRSELVRVTNSCYISLFDKSDEALVNDYEEILELLDSEDNELAEAFNKLIDDFIHNNPTPINPSVEEDWDNTEVQDKLIFQSPIPLNSEQLQILSAINKEGCKYTIVEGPPGTGKSHTITAIVFDAILKSQSVLVLSDKKEALDVVEDKITETMNKVRYDKKFQNPILRLGKTGNTYSQILATSTVENIKAHYRAVKKDHEILDSNIDKLSRSLREDLEAEIISNRDISLQEIKELIDLESYFLSKEVYFDKDELLENSESTLHFEELRHFLRSLKDELYAEDGSSQQLFLNTVGLDLAKITLLTSLVEYIDFGKSLANYMQKLRTSNGNEVDTLILFQNLSSKSEEKLSEYLRKYKKLKQRFVGFLFRKQQVEHLDRLFRNEFSLTQDFNAHEKLEILSRVQFILSSINNFKSENDVLESFDLVSFVHKCLINEKIIDSIEKLVTLGAQHLLPKKYADLYPKTFTKLRIEHSKLKCLINNELTNMSDLEFDKLIRYVYLGQKISKDFSNLPEGSYTSQMKSLQELTTAQMTYHLDGRLIDFYENNKNTATHLRNIIRSKQRFPKDEFLKLKQAFPCILAGIRDYAEFIPLEPGMFDLLIIDEASQVSIAQAFPALLRAKKVLILGDRKQFSNIKSAQARSDTNREYLNSIKDSFRKHISNDEAKFIKLQKFDIKTSILEFFEYISNYRTQLLKHFRGYKEIISYSNKYFYQDNLQVMKIRGKRINEVLKFTIVNHDGKTEIVSNANSLEVDYIINELEKLKKLNSTQTIGIITPHTNQQKLFVERINQLPEKDFYLNNLKLKIMTFDTCQGEERDIIFYSMVATKQEDHLWGVFIKDLGSVDIEDDGKIKAQRLNVGFSRAKECMHFVLSKPIEEFNGSIGEAIRHYKFIHDEANKEHPIEETDKNSKMEPLVLNWFYQTTFWKNNKDRVEFIPQFELGKYLKQLDKLYNHPNFKVDFLLTYLDERDREHKIVIEYDGFLEHFKDAEGVNEFNYQEYYSENDLYRQKVLESYGYKFIRINRFNLGKDPISTLNQRIEKILKSIDRPNGFLEAVHLTVDNINNGLMRECPKCKELRDSEDFKDSGLITGYGRFCKICKSGSHAHEALLKPPPLLTNKTCPTCSSKMILRKGKFGKFYGCSRFPYCRGTRQYGN
jgi:superfamily I DNA and/or RNA helicase